MQSIQSYIIKWFLRIGKTMHQHREFTIEQQRTLNDILAKLFVLPRNIQIQQVKINDVPCEWVFHPEANEHKVVLYLHGGGYYSGSPRSYRALASSVSSNAKVRVLLVDYRLAPEHPFPAALIDALLVFHGLLDLGYSHDKIAVMGDSAGGGLSLAMVLALKDHQQPLPRAVVTLSPWTDLTNAFQSRHTKNKCDPLLPAKSLPDVAAMYAGDVNVQHTYISPIKGDFTGFPPLYIHVGSDEILLDDSRCIVDQAKASSVDVSFHIWKGMFHVWHYAGYYLPEGQAAIKELSEFIHNRLA